MRLPVRAITGHLLWGRDSTVWAAYRVTPATFPHLPAADKLRIHARLQAALAQIPGDALLLGIARLLDPGEVVEALVAGIDLDTCPAWRDTAAATLDRLDGAELRERRHYLVARLPDRRPGRAAWTAARTDLAARFGVPPAPISRRAVEGRLRDASLVEARLRRFLTLEPVDAGELRWLYARAVRRGGAEPYLDASWQDTGPRPDTDSAAAIAGPALRALAEGVFWEGGAADDPQRPPHRRYLRVDTATGTGYQAMLAVADMPREFFFPDAGGEWFRHLDAAGFPVDWCARVTVVPNEDAQIRARRQARQLASQFDEHDGETAGVPHDLLDAVAGVDEERSELAANRGEPELRVSILLATWAPTLDQLEARCEELQAQFLAGEYGLARPTGGQLALFTAMLPAGPNPAVARDYAQFLLPRDLAAGAPFVGCHVGDPQGMLLGENLDQIGGPPVLLDPAWGPSRSRSGSVGVAGNLGSGKSYLIKRVLHATLARGGRVVALDRTERGEYVAAAGVLPGRSQVIQLAADAPVSLDPMRAFTGDERAAVTTGFLTLLAQAGPTDMEGVAIAEAVEAACAQPDATIGVVTGHLQRLAGDDEAASTAFRKLRAMRRSRLAGLVFDPDRQLLATDADYLVFHTPGLALPRREELVAAGTPQLLPEQILAQALLYLVTAITRRVTFSDWSRFAAACLDEAWALTASPQGRQLVLDFVRDGRKHNAAVWLLSQHADDLGDDQLAHLLGTRFVFRQDPGAVAAALRFLGIEQDTVAGELLTAAQSGQALLRDGDGRVGYVQILPAEPELHAAFDTNPGVRPSADRSDTDG